MSSWERTIGRVVASGGCSGCGLCARLDPSIRMSLNEEGYLRPVFTGPSSALPHARKMFERSCPGRRVRAPRPAEGAGNDPLLGPYLGIWQAWAVEDATRLAGSSGGVLTALHQWLLSEGRASHVSGAAGDTAAARRTVPVTIMTREEALAAAGSRYAPVATLENASVLDSAGAVTAKPCEIGALRQSGLIPDGEDGPLLLSFFCAGTPSQHATDRLLDSLGVPAGTFLRSMRYRGNGWPGRFAATTDEETVSVDYEASWGRALGPTTQWRCKICPDGVGTFADIVSADAWATDERGYPTFVEGPGVSALIARTPRGLEAVRAAVDAGVIALRPLTTARLRETQPLQTSRRRLLFARLVGSSLAGRKPPTYRGFGLIKLTMSSPREAVRALRGTFRRVRAQRARRRAR